MSVLAEAVIVNSTTISYSTGANALLPACVTELIRYVRRAQRIIYYGTYIQFIDVTGNLRPVYRCDWKLTSSL